MNLSKSAIQNLAKLWLRKLLLKVESHAKKYGSEKQSLGGRIVSVFWDSFRQSDLFEWTFDDKGNFTGKYKTGTDQGAMKGTWNGRLNLMNIAGKYESNHGDVVITQTGNKITVAYQKAGTCKAELEGNVVRGQWDNFGQSGLFEWTFDDKGSFTGKYKTGTDQGAMKGTWSGKKIAETASTAGIQVKTEAIETDSNKNDAAINIAKIDGKAENEVETTQAVGAASAANNEPQPVSVSSTIHGESSKPENEDVKPLTAAQKIKAKLDIEHEIFVLQVEIKEIKTTIKEDISSNEKKIKQWERELKKAKMFSYDWAEAKLKLEHAKGKRADLKESVRSREKDILGLQVEIARKKAKIKMIK